MLRWLARLFSLFAERGAAVRKPVVEEVEPRILYSADANPLLWGGIDPSATAIVGGIDGGTDGSTSTTTPQAADAQQQRRHEIVFVDAAVPNAQELIDGILASRSDGTDIEIVQLRADANGLQQISDVLAGEQGIDAVHIVSHGESGRLWLGNGLVNSDRLRAHDGFGSWQSALNADADVLIWGCNVADGAAGQAFVEQFAASTGADVAASNNDTGSAARGADWTLEFASGSVRPSNTLAGAGWDGVLATFTVTNTNDSGAGSLRQAIISANASAGADIITFNISGTGVHTIAPTSALPVITEAVTIDATTDDSFAANSNRPAIVLAGNNAALGDEGLVLSANADGSTLRGLVIRDWGGAGILIDIGSNNNRIVGNYIGRLNTSGTDSGAGTQNGGDGILVNGAGNTIGGNTAADRNLISGNGGYGIAIETAGATGNVVAGNWIGVTVAGNAALANQLGGISLFNAANNTIGGSTAAHGNVIAGNTGAGVEIDGESADGNTVRANFIGVNAQGSAVLANSGDGIGIYNGADNTTVGGMGAGQGNWIGGGSNGIAIIGMSSGSVIQGNRIGTNLAGTANWGTNFAAVSIEGGASNTLIGGTAAGTGNVFAFNGINASNPNAISIWPDAGSGIAILGNTIYSHSGRGIDLNPNGITANDVGDADAGPNGLQNFPLLTGASSIAAGTTIAGSLNSNANTTYRIEFFANRPTVADATHGEGERYLGFITVTTDGAGNASVNTTLTNVWVNSGDRITATATVDLGGGNYGSTSEFAANVTATSSGVIVVDTTSDSVDGTTTSIANLGSSRGGDGRISLREAIIAANNTANGGTPDKIVFNIPVTDANHFYYRNNGVAGTFAAPVTTTLADAQIADFDADYIAGTARSWYRITLGAADLGVTQALIIDGSTQAGYDAAKGPVIEIDANGVSAGDPNAITLTTGASTIRGLVVHGAGDNAIEVDVGAAGSVIVGNYIGIDVSGTIARGNTGDGAYGALGIKADNVVIGGTTIANRNVIGGTQGFGIEIYTSASGASVQGNYIGVGADGSTALANAAGGIHLHDGAADNLIGGTGANQGNLIANNGGDGVWVNVDAGSANRILGNTMYSNGGQAIDIGANGFNTNDAGDGDNGANGLQNHPLLSAANSNAVGTTIAGTLNSNANTTYRIEFFSSVVGGGDSTERYLGFTTVTTNASGNASFNSTLTAVWINSGDRVAATATVDLGGGNYGSTSEVSTFFSATSSGIVVVNTVSDVADGTTTNIGSLGANRGADGRISLREAISATNNTANGGTPDKIVFYIDGSGPHVINVAAALPNITQALIIDGSTEPDYAGNGSRPVVVVDGNNLAADGLVLTGTADGSTVRGLVIRDFGGNGIHILAGADGNTIAGNYLGALDTAGNLLAGEGNGPSGLYVSGANNTIGGTAAGAGNVISGNAIDGLFFNGSAATGNVVQGSRIGTDASGNTALANGRDGIVLYDGAANNTIGGTAAGAGNLISGNTRNGIEIDGNGGTATANNVIQGNRIGTNAAGSAALANGHSGIVLVGQANNTLIGGTAAGAGNLVSGNVWFGIEMIGAGTNFNTVQGNLVGTDVTGMLALGNLQAGVSMFNGASNNLIGGSAAGARNVISASGFDGVFIATLNPSANRVQGNYIGTDITGNGLLGNGGTGVQLEAAASGNLIGGVNAGEGNLIAGNEQGVHVRADAGAGNAVLGNSIHSNTLLGIDLGAAGVTANDSGDGDSGANNLQNAPVLASAVSSGGSTTISGSLNSNPSTSYRIEFFSSPSADASGYGEGRTYLGFATVATDAAGNTAINAVLGVAVTAGHVVTATATVDLGGGNYGSTSEFAANVVCQTPPVNTVPGPRTVNEDSALVINGVSVSDPDGNLSTVRLTVANGTLSVSLAGGASISSGANASASLTLAGTQAQINAALAAITYQGTSNFNGSDTLTVLSTDTQGATDSDTVAITVTAVNDAPVTTSNGGGATAAVSSAENISAVTTVTSTDIDGGVAVYSIAGGADAARFAINASTGVLTFVAAPNYEAPTDSGANNVYDVTVQVSDGAGGTDTQAIAVTVTPTNDNAPVITSNGGGATATANVAENQTAVTTVVATDADLPAQTITYSIVGGADAALFSINAGTGALRFVSGHNYEAPTDAGADNVYDVIVQADDGAGGADTQAIAVSVTPVNEASPVITSNGGGSTAAISVAENTSAVTTVTATDSDLPAPTLTYSISGGADAARFAINASSGALTFVAAPNYEAPADAGANNVYDVTVTVSDGTRTDTQAIAVTVTPVNDNAPVIDSNGGGATASVSIAENSSAVTTVTASDADLPAQTLSYSISGGADAALFSINPTTGTLTFNSAPNFEAPTDAGANNVYDVIVQASDGAGLTDTQAIAVTVSNINEAPVITSGATVNAAENQTTVTTVTSSDVDGGAAVYSIAGGADAARFTINAATGVLTFTAAPNFEAPADAGANNVYDVTVQVADGNGGTAMQAIVVTVTNVNEAPTNTVPGAQTTSQNTSLVFSGANGNAISIADVDAGAAAVQVSLTASNGALTLGGTAGLTFTSGDGSADATMTFSGSVANINAALQGLGFAPTAGYSGAATLQITTNDQGNSGSGGALADTDTVTVWITSASLWVSSAGANATSSPGSGGVTWTDGQVVNFGNPNLALGSGATTGTFSSIFDIDSFAGSDTNLTGLHYVKNAVTVGSVNPVTLQAGDVLLSISADQTLGGVSVTKNDIVVFRPTTPGNYASGSFSVLIRDPGGTGKDVLDFALVEQPITVGGTALQAGDFLLAISGATYDNDIWLFRPTTMSGNPTGGSLNVLIDGGSAGINWGGSNGVHGVEFVNATTVIGGQTLNAGTVLVSLSGNGSVGSNALAVGAGDVFVLNVAATGAGTSSATASMLLRSADVGLTTSAEWFDAIALVSNASQAPVLTLPGGALNYTENAAAAVIDATATVADSDSPNLDSGVLVADFTANGTADDRLAIRNQGTGAGQIGISGANVTYGGVIIGSWSGGGDGSTPLVVTFNASATPAAAQALLRNITYANVSDAPSTTPRTVRFVLTDGDGGTSGAPTKTINVIAVNDAPVITSNGGGATAAVNAAENQTAATTVTSSDVDGGALVYSIAGGVDAALFTIHATTGVLSFNSAPNHEAPSDNGGNNVYDVTVQVSDGAGGTDTQAIAVTVTPVNDNAPVITSNGGGATASVSIAENSSAVTTVTASDADLPAQTITYSISGGADAARFAINANTGALSFIAAPDYEATTDAGANNVYDVIVMASDGAGSTDTQAIAVTVSDVSSTLIVTTVSDSNDSGLGASFTAEQLNASKGADNAISLREAIIAANNTTNPYDLISFNIAGAGVRTITVGAAALPTITGAVLIDGWSQGGFAGNPLIELSGNYAGSGVDGLTLGAGSSGSTLRGLIVNRFTGNGVEINGSGSHTLQGNWIGLDATGTAVAANVENGIYATGSSGNLIGGSTAVERNVISGNGYRGIHFVDVDGSTIAGNYVGTDITGTTDVNGAAVNLNQSGIVISSGSDGNLIGGTTAGSRNIISGNNHFGIEFQFGSQNNRLEGNYIGTTATGLAALGNLSGGVAHWNAGSGNVTGGGAAGAGNVISGNGGMGVLVGNASVGTVVQGNLIGLGVDGNTLLGNGDAGVLVEGASVNTLIGSDANGANDAAEGNVISGNSDGGVVIAGAGTSGTRVQGNLVGTNSAGTAARGNAYNGVAIFGGATGNTIGDNLLSGNGDNGIAIAGSGTSGNLVQGNVIGLNAAQTAVIGNASQGLWIGAGASGNTIGGAAAGEGNIIAGNTYAGIELHGAGTDNNTVAGNVIGSDATGTASFGNGSGITIIAGASNNLIGGTAAGAGNLIANNGLVGVVVESPSSGNAILRNAIRDNGWMGIDFNWDGVTPNYAGDADGGANEQQNFPVLTSVTSSGGSTTIAGAIDSSANTTLRIEFFSSPAGDGSGHGEGAVYLGFATVTTDGSGTATINSMLAGVSVTAGHVISATATVDLGGGTYRSTSEFSANVICQTPPINTVPAAQSVNEDTALVIGGVSVADLDGNLATVRLTVANGTLNVSLAGGATVSAGANGSTTLTLAGTQAQINAALAAISYQGTNHFNGSDTLTVLSTDALGATDSDSVAITVTAVNDAPVITSNGGGATATASVAENVSAVTTVTSTDIDGGTAVYSIAGGADAARFTIDASTGALAFIIAPDFEAPSDAGADNVYELTVQVSDGNGGFDTQAISVTVSDVSSTLLVTTTADSNDSGLGASFNAEQLNASRGADGAISLREAIIAANNTAGTDTITFDLAGVGVQTINVAAALPTITGTVIIDGRSDPDFAGTPVVELNGAAAGAAVDGLHFASASSGSAVRGLVINRFAGDGLFINGASNLTVQGNWIGLAAGGSAAAGNGERGVFAVNGGGHQIIGNVISGNAAHGILFGSVGNSVIAGNLIGTDAAGLADIDGSGFNASGSGILLLGSSGNLIGGTTAAARNVVSGNNHFGIEVGSGSQNNLVQGNYIGTDISGANALGNTTAGVGFWGAGTGNVLGGGQAGAGNLISGNAGAGVLVANASVGAVIQGNTIGLAADGDTVLANGGSGVDARGASTNTLIGTDGNGANDAAERNIISGNLNNGVAIGLAGTTGTVVAGNFIGTNAAGTAARGNAWNGVSISGGATNNTIGGTAAGAGNVISGNLDSGITIVDSGTSGNVVLGNTIGLDAAQSAVLGNAGQGLWIGVGASANTVGGTAAGAGNVISGNGYAGVVMWGTGTNGNSVVGNIIGSDASGSASFGNGRGVAVVAGASNTLIGGTAAGAGNLIANNIGDGIYIDTGSTGNALLGNAIRGNGELGIDLGVDGVTANDAGDADGGANGLQNFPVIAGANSIGGNTTITGTINSTANTTLRIEFFSAPAGDVSGYGQGQSFLGFIDVTTDAAGHASFTAPLGGVSVSAGHAVSATATVDLGGGNYADTSEFSAHVACTNNSAPVNSVPGAQTINEDTLLAISGLSVGDAQGNLTSVQLSVGQGTLALNLSGGATISSGANGSATLTLAGTQAQINSALATLGYQGNANYFGSDMLTVVSTDSLGASDSDTVAITVGAVNDAPVVTSAGAVSVAENQTGVVTVTSSDVDGGAPVYSIAGGADAALFTINPTTGVLTFTSAPNFEAPADAGADNIYHVIVQVSDGVLTGAQAISVAVGNVNEAPSGTDRTLTATEDTALVFALADFSFADPDAADSLSVVRVTSLPSSGVLRLNGVAVSSGQLIDAADIAAGLLSYLPPANGQGAALASFGFALRDQGALEAAPQTLTIDVTAVNDAPLLSYAGGSATIPENYGPLTLAPSATVADVDSANFDGGQLVTSVSVNALPEDRLTVRHVGSGAGQVGVSGSNISYGGVVIGSFNGAVSAGTALVVTFNASANAAAVQAVARNVTYENTSDTPSAAPRTLQGYLTDGDGGTSNLASGTITTSPVNDAPVIVSNGGGATAALGVAENQTAVTVVMSSDVDGGAPVYAISGGADAALFTIDAASGVLTFIAAPNFEAPADADADNVYDVTVRVSDGALADTQSIAVTVSNVNEAPVITSAGAVSVAENQAAVLTAASSDVDGGSPAYTIVGGADAALFTIDPTTGVLSFNSAPNFEAPTDAGADNAYDVTVQVADGNGGLATQAIAVTVTNVNEAPAITSNGGGASAGITIAENQTALAAVTSVDVDGGAAQYSIAGGADAARFTIDAAAGSLSFRSAPDFEAPSDADRDNVYELVVAVADGNGGSDLQSIAVAVTGVNEAPGNILPSAVMLAEQAPAGTVVAIVTASDPDAGDLFTFTLVNDGAGRFVIDPASGRLQVAPGAMLDFESSPSHTLIVRVTDAQGLRTEQTIVVTLRDEFETQPDVAPPDLTPPPAPTPIPTPTPPEEATIVPVVSAGSDGRDGNADREPATTASGRTIVDLTDSAQDDNSRWQPQRGRSPNEGGPVLVASVSFAVDGGAGGGWSQGALDGLLSPASQATLPRFGLFALRGSSIDTDAGDDTLRAAGRGADEAVLAAMSDPVRVASATLTAGFVWWLTRSGGLLTSILMGIPAWRHVDLLPVLAPAQDDEDDDEDSQGADSRHDAAEPSRRDSQIDDLFSNTSRMFGESRFP
jgi:Domain of unknown function (DUF4347)/Cadherin domain/Right handed beta helix region/Periplasmic copper-binding protein (NosD)